MPPQIESEPLRIIFFGSSNFALPTLQALTSGPDQLVLVVTSPPAPSGRGQALTSTTVSVAAREAGLPVLETDAVNSFEIIETIERFRPDLLTIAAFGGFLGSRLLDLGFTPPMNIHPSLLPKHRGPAPVNWTIISGDQECGVSICFTELKIDAGPVLAQKSRSVPEGMSAGALEAILAEDGAALLMETIHKLKSDSLVAKPQNEEAANFNRLMTKKDGRLDFTRPAQELASLVNGVDPWPGAQAKSDEKLYKFYGARARDGQGQPGQVMGLDDEGRLTIGTGSGILTIEEIQPEGRLRLPAADFCRGYRISGFESLS